MAHTSMNSKPASDENLIIAMMAIMGLISLNAVINGYKSVVEALWLTSLELPMLCEPHHAKWSLKALTCQKNDGHAWPQPSFLLYGTDF